MREQHTENSLENKFLHSFLAECKILSFHGFLKEEKLQKSIDTVQNII